MEKKQRLMEWPITCKDKSKGVLSIRCLSLLFIGMSFAKN